MCARCAICPASVETMLWCGSAVHWIRLFASLSHFRLPFMIDLEIAEIATLASISATVVNHLDWR